MTNLEFESIDKKHKKINNNDNNIKHKPNKLFILIAKYDEKFGKFP